MQVGYVICDYLGCGKVHTITDEKDLIPNCGRCKRVHYCGKECQRAAWSSHREGCGNSDKCRYHEIIKLLKTEAAGIIKSLSDGKDYVMLQDNESCDVLITGEKKDIMAVVPEEVSKNVALRENCVVIHVRGMWLLYGR